MDPHPHPALWAERNERLWLDGVPGQGLKPDRARKLRQDGLSFHQGKMVPDADTRPAPKGHEGIVWQMLPHLWAKTIWIEAHHDSKQSFRTEFRRGKERGKRRQETTF